MVWGSCEILKIFGSFKVCGFVDFGSLFCCDFVGTFTFSMCLALLKCASPADFICLNDGTDVEGCSSRNQSNLWMIGDRFLWKKIRGWPFVNLWEKIVKMQSVKTWEFKKLKMVKKCVWTILCFYLKLRLGKRRVIGFVWVNTMVSSWKWWFRIENISFIVMLLFWYEVQWYGGLVKFWRFSVVSRYVDLWILAHFFVVISLGRLHFQCAWLCSNVHPPLILFA